MHKKKLNNKMQNPVVLNDASRPNHHHVINVRRNWSNQLIMDFMKPVVNSDGSFNFKVSKSHVLDKIDSEGRQTMHVHDADNHEVFLDAELTDGDLSVDVRSESVKKNCSIM